MDLPPLHHNTPPPGRRDAADDAAAASPLPPIASPPPSSYGAPGAPQGTAYGGANFPFPVQNWVPTYSAGVMPGQSYQQEFAAPPKQPPRHVAPPMVAPVQGGGFVNTGMSQQPAAYRESAAHYRRAEKGDAWQDPSVDMTLIHNESIYAYLNQLVNTGCCRPCMATACTCGLYLCCHKKTRDTLVATDRRAVYHSRKVQDGRVLAGSQDTFFLADLAYVEQYFDNRTSLWRKICGCCFNDTMCPEIVNNKIRVSFGTYGSFDMSLKDLPREAMGVHRSGATMHIEAAPDSAQAAQTTFMHHLMTAVPIKGVIQGEPNNTFNFDRRGDSADDVYLNPAILGFGRDEKVVDAIPATIVGRLPNWLVFGFYGVLFAAAVFTPQTETKVAIFLFACVVTAVYQVIQYFRRRRRDIIVLTDRRLTQLTLASGFCVSPSAEQTVYSIKTWMIPGIVSGDMATTQGRFGCGGHQSEEIRITVAGTSGSTTPLGDISIVPQPELSTARVRGFMQRLLTLQVHPVLPHRAREDLPDVPSLVMLPGEKIIASLDVLDRGLSATVKAIILFAVLAVGVVAFSSYDQGENNREIAIGITVVSLIALVLIFLWSPLYKRGHLLLTSHRLVTYENYTTPKDNYFGTTFTAREVGSLQRFWMLRDIKTVNVRHVPPGCMRKDAVWLEIHMDSSNYAVNFELHGDNEVMDRANDFTSLLYVTKGTRFN